MNNEKTVKEAERIKKFKVLMLGISPPASIVKLIQHESCEIESISTISELTHNKKLSDYDIVILRYSAFAGSVEQVNIIEKQMVKALDQRKCFCFLHHSDDVPSYSEDSSLYGNMNRDQAVRLRTKQIGFRWLYYCKIRPILANHTITTGKIIRNELKKYLDDWGASYLYFQFNDNSISIDNIFTSNNYSLAFTINARRGKLIYVPYQVDTKNHDSLKSMLNSLIDCLVTYLIKSQKELPEWAKTPLFNKEQDLYAEKLDLEDKLKNNEEKLDNYFTAKQFLFQGDYELEESLPKFLREQFQLNIKREDRFIEDFWILDSDGKEIVICECKSKVKGLSRSIVFSLYMHREHYGLEEKFPAVLFVNPYLNASSWEQKNKEINKEVYKEAASKKILILRIEDVLFAWQALEDGALDKNELLEVFANEVGWLHFKKDNSWKIYK